jgi:tetratricopeptide (TPR) repeat protein
LARQHQKSRDYDAGVEVLRRAVSLNPNNKDVHFALADALRRQDENKNRVEIGQHLRKSFSDGDNRYDARMYFARYNYLYGDRGRARKEFEQLSRVPLSPWELSNVRGLIRDSRREPIVYSGEVIKKQQAYCFVRCHALEDVVFIHARTYLKITHVR